MKLNYFILIAALSLGVGYYFYSSSPQPQEQSLSSEQAEPADGDDVASGEKEFEYDELTPEQQAALDKEDASAEINAAEAEYAIEQAPANSDGYVTTDHFTDESSDLMAQALAN